MTTTPSDGNGSQNAATAAPAIAENAATVCETNLTCKPQRYTTQAGLWVERVIRRELGAFEHECCDLLDAVFAGIHNAPINFDRAEFTAHHVLVRARWKSLATWDFNELTRLVVLAHDAMIRVEISAAAPKVLSIFMHPRLTRDKADGIARRMPTIEEAITVVRERSHRKPMTDKPAWLGGRVEFAP